MSYKFFMQIKKAEMKLRSIHVNLTTDNTKKSTEFINDFSIIKQEKPSSYSGISGIHFSFFLLCTISHHILRIVIDDYLLYYTYLFKVSSQKCA